MPANNVCVNGEPAMTVAGCRNFRFSSLAGTRPMRRVSLFLLILSLFGSPLAHAADVPVDLELALGIDVSGSVDEEEAVLQRNGYIAAFRHPSIVDAIQHGGLGRIAVSYYEWAGFGHMKIIAPWTLIKDKATADGFADLLTREQPETARRTAIAAAISTATVKAAIPTR